ncbi:MAG: tetratricopeptide repeat protein, partial [Muribaculaceae bacterium]
MIDVTNIRRTVALLISVLFLMTPQCLVSQNNPYKINDELYTLYKKAYKYRTRRAGVELADSMYKRAVQLDDKKASCLAQIVRMSYQFHNAKTLEAFDEESKRLMEVAQNAGMMQYYFYALSERGSFLLNKGEYLLAISNARQVYDEAEKRDDNYGRLTYYTSMARVHLMQNDYNESLRYFLHAYDYCKESVPDQDPSTICYSIATVYFVSRDFTKSLEWAKKGLAEIKENGMDFRLNAVVMQNLFKLRRYDEFKALYDKYEQQLIENPKMANALSIRVNRMALDGNFDGAYALIAQEPDSLNRMDMQSAVLLLQNRYYELYQLSIKIFNSSYNKNISSVQPFAMSEVEAAVSNTILHNEQLHLQYLNVQSQLQNSLNAGHIAENKVRLEQMKLANDSIGVLRDKIDRDRAVNERRISQAKAMAARDRAEKRRITTAAVIVTALIMILYGLVSTLLLRRRRRDAPVRGADLHL